MISQEFSVYFFKLPINNSEMMRKVNRNEFFVWYIYTKYYQEENLVEVIINTGSFRMKNHC